MRPLAFAPGALFAALLLAGCGYTPPAQTNRATPTYTADLGACEDSASSAVNQRNAKTGLAWFTSPVRRWWQLGDSVTTCMAEKGYGRLRTCTDEELRAGNRRAVMVTAAGVQCADPPDARRRAG